MSEPKNLVIKVKRTTPDLNAVEPQQMVTEWNYKRIAGALVVLLALIGLCVVWVSKPEIIQGWLHGAPTKSAPSPSVNATPPTPTPAPAIAPQPPAPAPTPAVPPAPEATPPAAPAPEPATPTSTPAPAQAPAPTAPAAKPVSAAPAAPPARHADDTPPAAKSPARAPAAAPATPETPVAEAKPNDAPNTGKVTRASLAYRLNDNEPADSIQEKVVLGNIPTAIHYFTEIQNMKDQALSHEWWKNGQRVMSHQFLVTTDKWRGNTQRQLNANDAGLWTVRTRDAQGILLNEIAFTVSPR